MAGPSTSDGQKGAEVQAALEALEKERAGLQARIAEIDERGRGLDTQEEAIARDGGQSFVAPNFGFCLFERAWSLRGFESFLMDLALNLALAEELLERITEIQVALARRFVAGALQ